MFTDKVVVITGAASGIGQAIAQRFSSEGAHVCTIDTLKNDYYVGDVGDQQTLHKFAQQVLSDHHTIDVLVNNAPPLSKGLESCSYEEFSHALAVGVSAPFYLAKLFASHFSPGGSIINISSTRERMSQPNTESYAAAKGGIASLTHALAITLGPNIRVNAIAPGWIDTTDFSWGGSDAAQHPAGRVGRRADIVELVLFLASESASFITAETITVDGGMSRQMIYHNDWGWKLTRESEEEEG